MFRPAATLKVCTEFSFDTVHSGHFPESTEGNKSPVCQYDRPNHPTLLVISGIWTKAYQHRSPFASRHGWHSTNSQNRARTKDFSFVYCRLPHTRETFDSLQSALPSEGTKLVGDLIPTWSVDRATNCPGGRRP